MSKITFLGSCREVGRSAILIESKNGDKCLLDYGIRFNNEDRLPYETNLRYSKRPKKLPVIISKRELEAIVE